MEFKSLPIISLISDIDFLSSSILVLDSVVDIIFTGADEDDREENNNLTDVNEDDEGSDEFYDTHADPSTPVLDLVSDIILLHPVEDQSDPPLPSITVTPQSFPTPLPHSPVRCPLQMRELNSSPISRPAWSLRAEEDTSLFVPSPSASSPLISPSSLAQTLPLSPSDDTLSMAIPVPRRRAYRSPIPEFDIALAMQLRPGLGIGADPAWMVRFLMAMFGWFTVLLSGKKDRQQRLVA